MSTPNPSLPREEIQRRFNDGDYWQRMQRGEFQEVPVGKPHKVAYKGILQRHPDALGVTTHYRDRDDNTIVEVHYYIDKPGGAIIPGKRPDPKKIFEDGKFYHEEKLHRRVARLTAEYESFKDATIYEGSLLLSECAATNPQELKECDERLRAVTMQHELCCYLHSRWLCVLRKLSCAVK